MYSVLLRHSKLLWLHYDGQRRSSTYERLMGQLKDSCEKITILVFLHFLASVLVGKTTITETKKNQGELRPIKFLIPKETNYILNVHCNKIKNVLLKKLSFLDINNI